MGLFGALARKPHSARKQEHGGVALIDIGTESVAGAYALFSENEQPFLIYATQVPVQGLSAEAPAFALERALSTLGDRLMREGGPVLWKTLGSAHISTVLVSIDAPWQQTALRMERLEEREPFTFTKALVSDIFGRQGRREGGRVVVDRSVVGTALNGYDVREPYRKKATRAAILHITSSMEEQVFARIDELLRRLFLGARVHFLSGSSLRFQAIRAAFPHEQELLIVDCSEPKTSLLLVRGGLPSAIIETPREKSGRELERAFSSLAKQFPIPSTIIVAGRPEALEETRNALRACETRFPRERGDKKLLPLQKRHLSRFIDATRADLGLLLMAFFYQLRARDLEDMHTSLP